MGIRTRMHELLQRAANLSKRERSEGASLFFSYFFFMLWIYFNFSSSAAMAFEESSHVVSMSYNMSQIANSLTLVFGAIFYRRVEKVLFGPMTLIGSVILCSVGTMLVCFPGIGLGDSRMIILLGGMFTGIGSALMLLMLGLYFTQHRNLALLVFAALLAANLAASMLYHLPQPALFLLVLCLPCAIAVILGKTHQKTREPREEGGIDQSDLRKTIPLLCRFAVMILVFYASNGFAKEMYRNVGVNADSGALLITSLMVAVVLALSCLSYGRYNTVSLYRTVFLFLVACFIGIPLLGSNYSFSYGMMTVSVVVFRSLMLICECQICLKTGLSPVLVFGIFETIKRVPNIACFILFDAISFETAFQGGYLLAFLVPTILLVFIYVLVFTERDVFLLTEFDRRLSAREVMERQQQAMAKDYSLTERETEVFLLLVQGRSAARIAKELYLSQGTVNVYVKKIYRKLNVHSRQELLDKAEQQGKSGDPNPDLAES